jgi:NAD(P)-dependent dehydrogenase (short-subunit alcohol dehydrogenase family)
VILVTGAGQGLGKAIAMEVAARGATVILHGRNLRKIERVYDAILAQGQAEPLLFPLDFNEADDAAFEAMAAAIAQQFGRLDHLVHCAAALGTIGPFAQQGLAQWLEVLRVNVAATAALTARCFPLLKSGNAASLTFTLADRGQAPRAYWGAFASAKAAVAAMVATLADEWENEGVRVYGVVPGAIHSPSRTQTHPGASLQDLPAPSALAPLYASLIENAAAWKTGTVIDAQSWLRTR